MWKQTLRIYLNLLERSKLIFITPKYLDVNYKKIPEEMIIIFYPWVHKIFGFLKSPEEKENK